jgi:hypothetical protein
VRRTLFALATLVATCGAALAGAQVQRPRVELTPEVVPARAAAGSKVRAAVKVVLPADVHVQSDKPRDPSLIPTVLTVTAPPEVTVDRIVYPAATDLRQAGREAPLAVFGPEFTIDVHLSLPAGATPGALKIPAQLRYQACNDQVCFPPARASMEWTVTIEQ